MESERARRMADRVVEALARAGLDAGEAERVRIAYADAIRWREAAASALDSDRHPAFLHPGRTVLILADDVVESNPAVLAAAALTETRDRPLRVPDDRATGEDEEALGWRREVPPVPWRAEEGGPDGVDGLLEALVTGPVEVQRIVLAEALDHVRHAHLWTGEEERARAAELTSRVFVPLAARVDTTLSRRYRWWERRVGSVLARPARGAG